MKLNFHLGSFARSVTPVWARYVICQTSLQAMLYSCNPAFIHFAFQDLWLQFGRVICSSTSPLAAAMNMFLAPFRFFLQPLLLSFVPFPTNVNFVPYFVLCSFAAFYTPLSTPFPLFLSRPFSAPALPDHISGNSGFRPLLLRYQFLSICINFYPFLSIPIHSCPFLSIPTHSHPFLSIPTHSYPFLSILIHSYPFHSTPFQSYPFLSIPIRSYFLTFFCYLFFNYVYPFLSIPIRCYPFLSIPIHSYPFLSIPIHSYPFLSIPVHSYPFLSIPFHSYPFLSVLFFWSIFDFFKIYFYLFLSIPILYHYGCVIGLFKFCDRGLFIEVDWCFLWER